VNVAGKGIVLIIGCGHQGVRRIVERAESLFDETLYGLVGGLHLPVASSGVQRVLGTGRPPWQSITKDDVVETIEYLKGRGFIQVALSLHDSCDWTASAFERAWGSDFQVVKVGEPIDIPAIDTARSH
jgi:7,8-dihydropterin-6-yl-methyl-4-(beta-D-ribofuranosyl)aminobenzene 5'-phosphate synthase